MARGRKALTNEEREMKQKYVEALTSAVGEVNLGDCLDTNTIVAFAKRLNNDFPDMKIEQAIELLVKRFIDKRVDFETVTIYR